MEEQETGCKNLNTAWEGIWVLNTQAKTSYVNQQMADMLGYSVVEMLGHSFFDYIDAAARIEIEQHFKQPKQSAEKQYECKLYRKDSLDLLVNISINPVFGEKGEFTGVVGLVANLIQRQQDQERMLRAKTAEADKQQLEKEIAERKQVEEALAKSEERYRMISELTSDFTYVASVTPDGQWFVEWVTEAFFRITGYTLADIEGPKGWICMIDPDDLPLVEQYYQTLFSGQASESDLRIITKGGETRWLRSYARLEWDEAQQQVIRMLGAAKDITEHKQAKAALAKSEAKFRSLIQNSLDMITLLEANGTVQYESPSIEKIVGYEPEDLLGKNIFEFIHLEDAENVINAFHTIVQNPGATLTVEFRFQHQDGSWRVLEATGNNLLDDPSVGSIVINSRDITERKWVEEQLRHNALYDELTDLANRTLFMNQLEQEFKRAKRHKDYVFAVLFLDLDRFKVINDSLGHTIGDQLLIAVSQRLKACLREVDTIARLGGDEFAILLNDIREVNDAIHTAERIKKALTLPLNLSGREVFSSVSIGIAISTTGYSRPEDLLRDADTALYRAKALGKGRHEIFDADMHTHAVTLLQLETDLRQAIERQEFQIYYQPIISLETSKIAGFEALVRWRHPQRGLVLPTEFIAIAEETGLIVPIGWWILREACRQMQAWQRQSPMTPLAISVNLSVRQFTQPELIEQIDQILWETRLDASSLRLEITESVLIENPTSATAILSQLTALGVQLYMDDFGTGYSSLSYLHRFPVSALKIDRSFISNMDSSDKNSEIVRAITTLALALGIDAIAEGVETVEQLAQLRVLKCKYAQGYLFAKPMDAEAAGALVMKNPQWYG